MLSVLHDNHLTHTDLKPENILFVDSGADVVFDPQKVVTSASVDNLVLSLIHCSCQCLVVHCWSAAVLFHAVDKVSLLRPTPRCSYKISFRNQTFPCHHTTPSRPFYGPFSGTTRVSRYQKRTLDFMVQGKINRGIHTDHPAGRHSIRTNQCQPAPSTHFLQAGCPSCHPANSVKALKAA